MTPQTLCDAEVVLSGGAWVRPDHDLMEEIRHVVSGVSLMRVLDATRIVRPGDPVDLRAPEHLNFDRGAVPGD